MNELEARIILGDSIKADDRLDSLRHYMDWTPGDSNIRLDDWFELEELKAIVWWMEEKGGN